MKKVLLILVCFFLLVGCSNSDKEKQNSKKYESNDSFVLEKVIETEELVYFKNYKEVSMGGISYYYKYPVINIKGDNIDNVNLELKSFTINSYNNSLLIENVLSEGKVLEYDYFISDNYVTVIQTYYDYIDGIVGEKFDNIFIISKKTGKIVDNETILKDFEMNEDELFSMLEEKVDTDDVSFTLMNIRNNGYKLYVDNDNKMNIIYYEVTNDEEIKKWLVLN